MLWSGNSPDLSGIGKAWPWMKRVTTFKGAPRTRTDLETSWMSKWGTIPQDSTRGWIEGIMENIKKIIALEGGNEYPEGRESKRSYKGRRRIGELFKHSWIQDDQDSDDEDSDDYEDIETEEEDEFDADATN